MEKMPINNKSQMWFMDFAIALVIFSVILILYFNYTANLSKQDSASAEDLTSDSKNVASSLLLPGFPEEWNNETVQRIGLTNNDQRLNESKLKHLAKIPYTQAKRLFGTVNDFFIFFEDKDKNLISIGTKCAYGDANVTANSSYKLAAYFNQADDEMQNEMDELEQKLGIDIYRDWTSASNMLNNISRYAFVLMEKPKLSSSQAAQLEAYVASGGFIFISERILNANSGTVLGVQYDKGTACNKNATVVHDDLFLSLKIGDKIKPDQCAYVSGDITTIAQFPNGDTSIAKWEYGNGSVYYFSDFEVDSAGAGGDLQRSIKDALEGSILTCGKSDGIGLRNATYSNLIKVQRDIIYKDGPVKMTLYLWD